MKRIMEPDIYYKIYRRTRCDWVEYVNMCHKWTQTTTNCPRVISKAWQNSSDLLLQAEVNRVVELYSLTGSRDLNTNQAIAEVISHQCQFQDDKKIHKLLQRKIGRRVTHTCCRKYYNKMKNKMKQHETDKCFCLSVEMEDSSRNTSDFSPCKSL